MWQVRNLGFREVKGGMPFFTPLVTEPGPVWTTSRPPHPPNACLSDLPATACAG